MDPNEYAQAPPEGWGYIYRYIVAGKYYIGQTIQSMILRDAQHRHGHSNTLFDQVLKMYPDDYKLDIICMCKAEALSQYESVFIKAYGSQYPNGYNKVPRAPKTYAAVRAREVINLTTGEKYGSLSEAGRHIHRTTNALRDAIVRHQRCDGCFWAYTSDEYYENASSPRQYSRLYIKDNETGRVYKSMQELAEAVGVPRWTVVRRLKGGKSICGKFYSYLDPREYQGRLYYKDYEDY